MLCPKMGMAKMVLEYVLLQSKAIPNNPIIKLNKKYRNSNSIVFFMLFICCRFSLCKLAHMPDVIRHTLN